MQTLGKPFVLLGTLSLIAAPTAALLDSGAAPAQQTARYEISVTNLTRGQIFSPPVLATHTKNLPPLWQLGAPASPELAGVAEDALNQPLIDALEATGQTREVMVLTRVAGPIFSISSA